jgi:N-methylhydantoinase A
MIAAMEQLTIWQGIDPREYLLVSGGAAAGLHVIPICRELGTKDAVMPKSAGGLSAVGGLYGDVVGEYSAGYFIESYRFDYENVIRRLEDLEQKAAEFLDRSGVSQEKRRIEFYCEARYPYQIWELSVRLRTSRIANQEDLRELVEDFHKEHERVFAVREDTFIECTNWRVRAVGLVDNPELKEAAMTSELPSDALKGKRRIFFDPKIGEVDASVYRGENLLSGNIIEPPSVIEEATTTLIVFPGSRVTVSRFGNYLIEIN